MRAQNESADSELPVGLILAGGMSRRFAGEHKALAELEGRPLIAHVIARLSPWVRRIVIACGPHEAVLRQFELPLLDDGNFAGLGPLAGILAGLQSLAADEHRLLSVPCDMPFVEGRRVQVLMDARQGTRPVAETTERGTHDGVVLWHGSHQAEITATLSGKTDYSIHRVLSRLNTIAMAAPADSTNINTPADLALASRQLSERDTQ
jgi:molybdopterin-guanine dinucleotide biosynthesis protein A